MHASRHVNPTAKVYIHAVLQAPLLSGFHKISCWHRRIAVEIPPRSNRGDAAPVCLFAFRRPLGEPPRRRRSWATSSSRRDRRPNLLSLDLSGPLRSAIILSVEREQDCAAVARHCRAFPVSIKHYRLRVAVGRCLDNVYCGLHPTDGAFVVAAHRRTSPTLHWRRTRLYSVNTPITQLSRRLPLDFRSGDAIACLTTFINGTAT